MGINDFNELSENNPAGSSGLAHEHAANTQRDWHKADTGTFTDGFPTTYTYFVEMNGHIKIGSSENPRRRLESIQAGFPDPLKVLAIVPFSVITEMDAHRKFAHLRVKNEWFKAAPQLYAFIDGLTAPPGTEDELSAYGKLNATRAELVALRKSSADPYLKNRCNILITNIDGLKKAPDDHALMAQMAKNTRELARYRAGTF